MLFVFIFLFNYLFSFYDHNLDYSVERIIILKFFLFQYIASQIAIFVFGLIGACVVLDFSTYDSSIQPLIRDVIVRLMNNPQHEGSREILRMVQEGVSIK